MPLPGNSKAIIPKTSACIFHSFDNFLNYIPHSYSNSPNRLHYSFFNPLIFVNFL